MQYIAKIIKRHYAKPLRLSIVLALLVQFIAPFAQDAHAGILTNTYVRLNRMKTGTATNLRLVFTNATAGTNSAVIDFNGVIDVGTAQWTNATPGGVVFNGALTVSTATCPAETGATAFPATVTAAGLTAGTITVSTTATMAAATTYCVDITTTNAITTPTVAGEYHPQVATKTGGVTTDSTNVALRIIANDQVTTTAIVPPIFTFVINSATDNFVTNLSLTSTVSTTGVTATITTNAATGWITWVKGTNTATSGTANYGALRSATAANYTIPSNATGTLGAVSHTNTAGTEDYGLAVTAITDAAGGGTVTADVDYDSTGGFATCSGNGTCKLGGISTSTFLPIAASTGTASGSGDVITFKERANISGATPAATDYTDTITVIGAGKF
jgi:hypothetical protein